MKYCCYYCLLSYKHYIDLILLNQEKVKLVLFKYSIPDEKQGDYTDIRQVSPLYSSHHLAVLHWHRWNRWAN